MELRGFVGVTLNPEQYEFSRKITTFLDRVISEQGIPADLSKTRAMTNMERQRASLS